MVATSVAAIVFGLLMFSLSHITFFIVLGKVLLGIGAVFLVIVLYSYFKK